MPPSKKRKLESAFPDIPPAFLSEVNEEVKNEIALKRQLTETLEARIAWALLLQDSIRKGNGNGNASASEYAFRNDALDALSLGEQSSQCILQGHPTPPPSAVDHNRAVRAAYRKQQAQSFPNVIKPKPSFLYTRATFLSDANANPNSNEAATENGTYILKCPECSRTAFTSLLGLLNHARLAHNLEWGTHETCIRSCAVADNSLDLESGIEVGFGPVGIPALRDLFQRAVNPQDLAAKERSGSRSRQLEPSDGPRTTAEEKTSSSGERHLVKTLGFHSDSPALARYLGKERRRREIKVWDEDLDVDAFGDESSNHHPNKKVWKMPFTPRNFVENSIAGSSLETSKSEQTTKLSQNHDNEPSQHQVAESDHSRFHIAARIVITDRSLWIPPEKKSKDSQKYSHKWMISVDSPAYTRHITSVLNSVKVFPSDSTLDVPSSLIASNPPFVVLGFTDRPFLAKIELSFSGTSSFQKESRLSEQKVSFEHWVALDPLEHREPCDGQDQVLDVDLDKNTILKPVQTNYVHIKSKSLWDQVTLASILDSQRAVQKIEKDEENKTGEGIEAPLKAEEQKEDHLNQVVLELPFEVLSVLNRCLKQIPMISYAIKANHPHSSSIPYRPVPSREHFNSLVLGRKKAIEWGRARAVQNAYTQEMENSRHQSLIPLTVASVYLWMSDNGHFIRERKSTKKDLKQEVSEAESDGPTIQFCPICGLEADLHRMTRLVKMEHPEDDEEEAKGSVTSLYRRDATVMWDQECECHIVPRILHIAKLPRINLSGLLSHHNPLEIPNTGRYTALNGGSLVATADPCLILSIHALLSKTYPSMGRQKKSTSYPVDVLGDDRRNVENTLSTPALLAHLTKQLLNLLIKSGLEVANRDKVIALGMLHPAPQKSKRSASGKRLKVSQLLTPTHVLSGVLTRGRGRGCSRNSMDTVVLSSLSKMGMAVENNDQLTPSRQGESGESTSVVKLEE